MAETSGGLGRVLVAQKRWAEARQHLEAAIKSPSPRPDLLPTVWLRLAMVAAELDDEELFSRAVSGAIAADARVGEVTGSGIAARDLAAARAKAESSGRSR